MGLYSTKTKSEFDTYLGVTGTTPVAPPPAPPTTNANFTNYDFAGCYDYFGKPITRVRWNEGTCVTPEQCKTQAESVGRSFFMEYRQCGGKSVTDVPTTGECFIGEPTPIELAGHESVDPVAGVMRYGTSMGESCKADPTGKLIGNHSVYALYRPKQIYRDFVPTDANYYAAYTADTEAACFANCASDTECKQAWYVSDTRSCKKKRTAVSVQASAGRTTFTKFP